MSFGMFLFILDRMEMKTFYIFWREDVVDVLECMYSKIILESKGTAYTWESAQWNSLFFSVRGKAETHSQAGVWAS